MLNDVQIERYSRQIVLPQVGGRGQEKLLSATIAILGSHDASRSAAVYVAAAGIGRLMVSAVPLVSELEGLNPDCHISALPPLTSVVAEETARRCDVILACGAGPDVCTALNSACIARQTPFIWGDTTDAGGLVAVLGRARRDSACYACIQPHVSRVLAGGDASHGLAEATAAFIGTLQATEAIKMLIGLDAMPSGRVLQYDAATGTVSELIVTKDVGCSACGVLCT
jgi:molybdopterin-synthase adenylyltransferase